MPEQGYHYIEYQSLGVEKYRNTECQCLGESIGWRMWEVGKLFRTKGALEVIFFCVSWIPFGNLMKPMAPSQNNVFK